MLSLLYFSLPVIYFLCFVSKIKYISLIFQEKTSFGCRQKNTGLPLLQQPCIPPYLMVLSSMLFA